MSERFARLLAPALAASFCAAFLLGARFDRGLNAARARRGLHRNQEADGDGGAAQTFQRIRSVPGGLAMQYGFVNFNRDALSVSLDMTQQELRDARNEYGYTERGLLEVKGWYQAARDKAYNDVVARGGGQAEVNAAAASVDREYDRRRKAYLASKGFKLLPGSVADIDVPLLVKRNKEKLAPLAQVFQKIGDDRSYGSDDVIGAVVAMVQTAILYKIPPDVDGDRHVAGLWPPLVTLAYGWGDCDTKTCLIGSILTNWPSIKMVGVSLPDHYLCAVLRIPNKGDAYVEWQGLQYVLVESAGPAWLQPGTVGVDTMPLLTASEGFAIEPFF